MWYDAIPAGKSWAALWFRYTRCACGGLRFQSECSGCHQPLPEAPLRDVSGRMMRLHVEAGGENRGEDWVYLQLMEREWKRPVEPAELLPLGSGPPPSARAGIVILFWTYFETRIERLLRAIWRDAPAPLLDDALKRYLSIGARLDRFYKLSCQTTYPADLKELGYGDVAEFLAEVQVSVAVKFPTASRVTDRKLPTFGSEISPRRGKLMVGLPIFTFPRVKCALHGIRECVRRHNRLPRTFVSDNGKEFESVYFEALLANFSLHKKSRPSGHPRLGAVCERLFGTVNTEFIHNPIGNTKHMKNARLVTKSFNPKLSAIWTLENLPEGLAEYCFEVYDNSKHPSHTLTPRVAYKSPLRVKRSFAAREAQQPKNFPYLPNRYRQLIGCNHSWPDYFFGAGGSN